LLQVARAADPDPYRDRLREALERLDHTALLELAASDEVFRLQPATLQALAWALLSEQEAGRALALLREAQRRHPGDFWTNEGLGHLLEKSQPRDVDEAIRFYTAALAVRPQSAGVHVNLGGALQRKGRLDEAIAEYQAAISLKAEYAAAHNNLGNALADKGQLKEAIVEYRKAIEFNCESATAHYNLGLALRQTDRVDEAIAEYQEAIRIRPEYRKAHTNLGFAFTVKDRDDEALAEFRTAVKLKDDDAIAHHNLGTALYHKGLLDQAVVELRTAIRLNPDDPDTHSNLGNALAEKGQLDEAIVEHRTAVRLQPESPKLHSNLGNALTDKGRLDEAIVEYQAAIRLKPDLPESHNNLAAALEERGRLDEAIAEYREDVRLEAGYAMAHKNLGVALRNKGQFVEALTHLRRSYELGLKGRRRNGASAELVKHCERLVELDGRLPAILSGKEQPAGAIERAEYAEVCHIKHLYAATARLYGEAIMAKPDLVASPVNGVRYNAACAAALAGCGAGEDAARLTDADRAALRKQAHDWLRADLDAWRGLLDKDPDKARPVVAQQVQPWLDDPDFNGVRGTDSVGKLPEAERNDWQKLWADVAATLASARAKGTPAPQPMGPGETPR
jgi:tetratricopeptide (TPR) repeat protein